MKNKELLKKPNKKFSIQYEFSPSKESEIRVARAYEMIFEEIDSMLDQQVLQSN